jgi:hypothetical protein
MKTQLLCTFSHKRDLAITLDYIKANYTLPENKIFVFANTEDEQECYCTYNIELTAGVKHSHNTILIHRKKESNSLYTVNALNCLVKSLTGKIDKTYQVNWSDYQNMLLLSYDGYENDLRKISLKMTKIFKL